MERLNTGRAGIVGEVASDPSLQLALATGTALTAFLAIAHACCIGLTDKALAPLLQICSFAG